MNKLELLRTKLEQARKELNDKGYHYDPSMYEKQGYNELMNIKPFEIKYQDVIEEIWPDEAWWKVLNYWDIFDAMAFGGLDDGAVIDEIINHVDKSFLEESCELKEESEEATSVKELESKYKCKFESGHKLSDWMRKYSEEYDNGELWDYSLDDFITGAVEPQEGLVYYLIKDGDGSLRAYETTEFCENCSESCGSLKEGTSNFGWLRNFPLLVFYTIDEIYDRMKYDQDYPQMEDFTTDKGNGDFHVDYDAYYDACDKFEQEYWNNIETAVLDESQVEELEDDIYNFNEETKRIANELYDADNEDDYYTLKDIEISVEPGYYEAAYISLPEKDFEYLSDEVKEAQLKRFHEFFDKLKNEHHLSHYEVAWGPASNGETGYRKVESCNEEVEEAHFKTLEDNDCDYIALTEYEGGEPVDYVKSDEELDAWLKADEKHSWFPVEEDKESLEKKKKDCHVTTNAGDPVKNAKFFNDAMGTSGEGAVGEDLKEEKEYFFELVFKEKDEEEKTERYTIDEFDDARADFIHMSQGDLGEYEYVVLRKVFTDSEEDIEVIASFGLDEFLKSLKEDLNVFYVEIDDNQNNAQAIIKITSAKTKEEACKKAKRLFIEWEDIDSETYEEYDMEEFVIEPKYIDKEYIVVDEDGEEVDNPSKIESLKEDLNISTTDADITVHSDSSVEVKTNEGTVAVNGDAIKVVTDNVDVTKEGENVTVGVVSQEAVETVGLLDTPETAEVPEIDSQETFVSDEVVAPVEDEVVSDEIVTDEVKEESLVEEPVYKLDTRYDSRDSFYGKAKVDARDDGSKILYSYETPVCIITKDGEVKLLRKGYLGWFSSQTTLRHVKEFLQQNGKEIGTKAQLWKMYPTEDAYDYIR